MASREARPRRADARRNYERVLRQARRAFAEFGAEASLDEIARQAGVASGTLYRHFPTRLSLIEAVLGEQIAELVELGHQLRTNEDESEALTTWLRAALLHALTYRGLAGTVMNSALDSADGPAAAWHAQLFEAAAALLDRARRAGVVVADADNVDVLKLLSAIAWASHDAPDPQAQADRLLKLVVAGLRDAASPHG